MKLFFAIEPQYDTNAGTGRKETQYVVCLPEDAETWTLLVSDTLEIGDWDILEDYPTRDAAYAAAMEMGYKPYQEHK